MKKVTLFSTRFAELRKNNKVTLKTLSGVIGITQQSIFAFEKGKTVPSFYTLIAIADYFNVSLDYLVGRSDEQ
ncbi:transcriptional regulator [Clostridia bacterium]|nr:transcriptional regulator [Clostridia bacterium]